jgi:bacterioferritin
MGTRAKAIIGIDVNQLIDMLNRALADEWLAYYQYWIGAKVVKGPMKDAAIAELEEHATQELNHANMLVDRILQLAGTPILDPAKWNEIANCKYNSPEDPYIKNVLAQNIEGEQCAINVYKKIMEETKDKDPITFNLALTILEEEIEHEEDLEALAEDLELMMTRK